MNRTSRNVQTTDEKFLPGAITMDNGKLRPDSIDVLDEKHALLSSNNRANGIGTIRLICAPKIMKLFTSSSCRTVLVAYSPLPVRILRPRDYQCHSLCTWGATFSS